MRLLTLNVTIRMNFILQRSQYGDRQNGTRANGMKLVLSNMREHIRQYDFQRQFTKFKFGCPLHELCLTARPT